jgi:dihydroorotate dehydrogenase
MNQPDSSRNIRYIVSPTPLQTSTLAIVSLIAGLLGFAGFPIIASIIAIITGALARQETRARPPRATGDGMATAGIIMGIIQIALVIIGICCFIGYFFFVMQSVLPKK